MSIKLNLYNKARREYEEQGIAVHDSLSQLCKNYPGHSDIASIYAKVIIIGRGYATGIERQIESNGQNTIALRQLSAHLLKNRKSMESIFHELSTIKGRLTEEKLETIVDLHGSFATLVSEVTRNNSIPRSFASKYMHFHNPIVPIYDSVAQKVLKKTYPWRDVEAFSMPKKGDEKYYRFALSFWQLCGDIKAAGQDVNVKLADNYLLWLAGAKQ